MVAGRKARESLRAYGIEDGVALRASSRSTAPDLAPGGERPAAGAPRWTRCALVIFYSSPGNTVGSAGRLTGQKGRRARGRGCTGRTPGRTSQIPAAGRSARSPGRAAPADPSQQWLWVFTFLFAPTLMSAGVNEMPLPDTLATPGDHPRSGPQDYSATSAASNLKPLLITGMQND